MKIIAHRGYSSRYPELSETAFRKALELPIHGVETDVRLIKDGSIVCIHDPILNRVSDGNGRVSVADLPSLKKLNFGTEQAPEKVLTLDELLDLMEDYPGKHLYIELKHPQRSSVMLEEEVVKLLRYRGLEKSSLLHFISFAYPALGRTARLAPHIDRIHLRHTWEQWFNPLDVRFGNITGLGLALTRAKLNPNLIGKKGLPTYLFTVNEEEDMRWALEHGVDMMATDEPERAIQVVGEERT